MRSNPTPVLIASITGEYPFCRDYRILYAEGDDPTARPWIVPALGPAHVRAVVPRVLVLGSYAGNFLLACHAQWLPDFPEEMRYVDAHQDGDPYWFYLRAPSTAGTALDLYGFAFDRCDDTLAAVIPGVDAVALLLEGVEAEKPALVVVAGALGPRTPVVMCGAWPDRASSERFVGAAEFPADPTSVGPVIDAIREAVAGG